MAIAKLYAMGSGESERAQLRNTSTALRKYVGHYAIHISSYAVHWLDIDIDIA